MSERYRVAAGRIHQELGDLDQVMRRARRAIEAAKKRPEDQDLYLDSVALNLHDFYAGLERIFHHIASAIDESVPGGHEWHRDLLRQMGVQLSGVRPPVLSAESTQALEDYLGFRHVVRNVYAFQFDPERIERLVNHLPSVFMKVSNDLEAFARFLEQLAGEKP